MQTFWERDKMLWGYNPLFMAGYPSDTIQDLSIKFFELFCASPLDPGAQSDPVV